MRQPLPVAPPAAPGSLAAALAAVPDPRIGSDSFIVRACCRPFFGPDDRQ